MEYLNFLFIQLLNGLQYGMLLFLLSIGLTLIFGMLDVINLAHGSFYMLGAYFGLTFVERAGNFWLAVVFAPIIVAGMGALIEYLTLRPLYRRNPLDQVILTFGFIYLFIESVKWIWGGEIKSIPGPPSLAGTVMILGNPFPSYRLFIIIFGIFVALLIWLFLIRTRLGSIIRAGVSDREMVSALGINISGVYTGVFALGTGLAALSGVIAGPALSAYPGMDIDILVKTLIVVVVGGMGSLKGSLIGSIIIAEAETFGQTFLPETAILIMYFIMAMILLFRPRGLFGQ